MISRIWYALLAAASVRTWAIIGAALPLTLIVGVIIHIVSDKSWGQPVLQLNILANLGYGPLIIIFVIIAALTGSAVVASVGKGGGSLSLKSDDDDEPVQAKIEGDLTITKEPKNDGPV